MSSVLTMPPLTIVCAAAWGLAVIATLLGVVALTRAGKLFRAARTQSTGGLAECQSAIQTLAESVDKLSRGQQEMERELSTVAVSTPPKPALNLTKRSQALRMHRRGDPPEQIASALDVPRQEVDLLVKVHRIVMSNV